MLTVPERIEAVRTATRNKGRLLKSSEFATRVSILPCTPHSPYLTLTWGSLILIGHRGAVRNYFRPLILEVWETSRRSITNAECPDLSHATFRYHVTCDGPLAVQSFAKACGVAIKQHSTAQLN
jgi:hypothetical protein